MGDKRSKNSMYNRLESGIVQMEKCQNFEVKVENLFYS